MSNPIKFRQHRGGFEESLLTVVVKPSNEIVNYITTDWYNKTGVRGTIHHSNKTFDKRKGWNDDSYLITINKIPVGYSNKPIGECDDEIRKGSTKTT